jgi:hypothetical protein
MKTGFLIIVSSLEIPPGGDVPTMHRTEPLSVRSQACRRSPIAEFSLGDG